MTQAHINRIATAVPPHDVQDAFLTFGRGMLASDSRRLALFNRMADRSGIAHRYSFLAPCAGSAAGWKTRGVSGVSPGNQAMTVPSASRKQMPMSPLNRRWR